MTSNAPSTPRFHGRPRGDASPTTRSRDPFRSAILAEAVENPNVDGPHDLSYAPVGSSCTAGPDGSVSVWIKAGTDAWAGHGGLVTDAELFALGVRRLSLGPVLRRTSTREAA
jgi:hypothetical protein